MNHPRPFILSLVHSFDASPDLRCRPLTDGVNAGSWLGHRIWRRSNGGLRNVDDLHRFPGSLIRCITDSVDETALQVFRCCLDSSGWVHYRR